MQTTICSFVRVVVLMLLLGQSVHAQTVPKLQDFATPQQRRALVVLSRVLCGSDAPSPHNVPSIEVQRYLVMMRESTAPDVLMGLTRDALNTALNTAGEGDPAHSWILLCRILDIRMRLLGAAAPGTVTVFNNFAFLLRKQGRVGEARRIFQLIEPIVRKYPSQGAFMKQAVLNNLGLTLIVQGYLDEGIATIRRAVAYAATPEDTASALTNVARALELQGKWGEAEQLHREILPLRHGLERAATLNNLGANLRGQGRPRDAEPFIREGLAIRQAELPPDHLNVGYSLATLVRCLLDQGRARDGKVFSDTLLQLRQRALGNAHPETSEALMLLAETQLATGETQAALGSARTALDSASFVAVRETSGLDEEAKVSGRRETANAAYIVVRAAWAVGGAAQVHKVAAAPALVNEAFLATQRITTSSILEAQLSASARKAAAGKGSGTLADTFEEELAKRAHLNALLAGAAATGNDMRGLQEQIARLDHEHTATTSRLREQFPNYFDLIRPDPVPLAAVAGLLKPDEALFMVTPGFGRERGFVWVVTRDDVVWSQMQKSGDDIEADISSFRRILAPVNENVPLPTEEPGSGWARSHDLYDAIFQAAHVTGVAGGKPRWIVAPQGVLMSLPFNALLLLPPAPSLANFPSGATLRAMRWLGIERDVSLIPSVGSLRVLRNVSVNRPATQPFFGLGDPYFPESPAARLAEAESVRGATSAYNVKLRELGALPGTRAEIEKLARLLHSGPASYVLGRKANEREFWKRQAAGQLLNAKVVAFATHGLMGGELGTSMLEPALVFSPPRMSSRRDDGLLSASEINHIKLRADWVLLSACNSAAGNRRSSEGLTGLARSFLYAGARSLLVSHWRVSDRVAPRISIRSIELAQGNKSTPAIAKTSAVRLAMLEVMQDPSEDGDPITTYAHPRKWAAFAFVGVD